MLLPGLLANFWLEEEEEDVEEREAVLLRKIRGEPLLNAKNGTHADGVGGGEKGLDHCRYEDAGYEVRADVQYGGIV